MMEWISVKDRLPDTNDFVQIVRAGSVSIGNRTPGTGNKWWDVLEEDWIFDDDWRPVTHWAPLLQPPAVGGTDELQPGTVVPFDDYSDVKVLAVVDGWAMIQRVHTVSERTPVVMRAYDLQKKVEAIREERAGKVVGHDDD